VFGLAGCQSLVVAPLRPVRIVRRSIGKNRNSAMFTNSHFAPGKLIFQSKNFFRKLTFNPDHLQFTLSK